MRYSRSVIRIIFLFLLTGGIFFSLAHPMFAAEEAAHAGETTGHAQYGITFLWIAVVLLAAKISSLVVRIGQPEVLGELAIGLLLGNLPLLGITALEPIKSDIFIAFLAQLGVLVLLFSIGLESDIEKMKQVGGRAFLVAVVGVVVPFVLGYFIVGPWLMPGLADNAYLFLGAALVATSVSIPARMFQDLGKLHTREAQIILGAAVIDDVLGLIILTVVRAIAIAGTITLGAIAAITGEALLFLAGAIVVGRLAAPYLGKFFSMIHTGIGMKFTLAVSLGLVTAFLSEEIGLAAIVGGFAAGLVLDPVHFTFFMRPRVVEDMEKAVAKSDQETRARMEKVIKHHSHKHVEDLLEPLKHFVVPVFFVVTGMSVDLTTLADTSILWAALGITLAAFVGKIAAGFVAGRVNKWIVGFGMVPRGEVGLIFATIGAGLGVVSESTFSVIVIMIILTTLLTPPILAWLLKRTKESEHDPVLQHA